MSEILFTFCYLFNSNLYQLKGVSMKYLFILWTILFVGSKNLDASCLSNLAASVVLPAISLSPEHINLYQHKHSLGMGEWNFQTKMIPAAKKGMIHLIMITPPKYHEENRTETIVAFNANMETWESSLKTLSSWAVDLNVRVVGFNYRGVGASHPEPRASSDLILDGLAVLDYLNISQERSEDRVLYGRSLGGAVATEVAYHSHKKGLKHRLFIDRSFKSLNDVGLELGEYIQEDLYEHKNFFFNILSFLPIGNFASFGISISNWEMTPYQNFLKIPSSHKFAIYVTNDEIISYETNLCSVVHSDNKLEFYGDHNDPLDSLVSVGTQDLNAKEVFYHFVQRR